MPVRKTASIFLILYAGLTLYTVLGVIIGWSLPPIMTPLNTLLAFVFAVLHGSQRLGWKNSLLLLGITFTVSLAFESVGVATGWVYGSYHYTAKLGPKFLGLVPLLIPLAWFMMSYPSFIIAVNLVPKDLNPAVWRVSTAVVGALVMTAWDLAMDPMMVAGGNWIWDQPGAFFGIPLQNYWGWWLTIFLAVLIFFSVSKISPTSLSGSNNSADYQVLISYAITGLSVVIVDLKIGLAGPALSGLMAMLPWILLGWLYLKRKPSEASLQDTKT